MLNLVIRTGVLFMLFCVIPSRADDISDDSVLSCPWTFGPTALTITPSARKMDLCHRLFQQKAHDPNYRFRTEGVNIIIDDQISRKNCSANSSNERFSGIDLDNLVDDDIRVKSIEIKNICSPNFDLFIKMPEQVNGGVTVRDLLARSLGLSGFSAHHFSVNNIQVDSFSISDSRFSRDVEIQFGEPTQRSPELDLSNLLVLGNLSMFGTEFSNLNLERININNTLSIQSPISRELARPFIEILEIRDVTASTFNIDTKSLNQDRLKSVEISDFNYERISAKHDDDVLADLAIDSTDRDALLTWRGILQNAKAPPGVSDAFTFSAYETLAKAARNEGKFTFSARTMVLGGQKFDRSINPAQDFLNWSKRTIGRVIAGYGHEPLRALPFLLGLVILGTVLTYFSGIKNFQNAELLRAKPWRILFWNQLHRTDLPTANVVKPRQLASNLIDRFWYSLEAALPLVSMAEDHKSIVHSSKVIDWYFHFHKIVGAILTGVFAVALAI